MNLLKTDPSRTKRVLFSSTYGTGKTILLKLKAKAILKKKKEFGLGQEDPGKVFFVTMCPKGSFLHLAIREEFREFGDDIQVLQVEDKGDN
jgi:hypothetical protein